MIQFMEPVNVWVLFEKTAVKPYLFFWKNRQIKIDQINLVHTTRSGASIFYHFSVSANGNFYRLKFDSNKLSWFLEAVEED